jgi:phage terminase small subunit
MNDEKPSQGLNPRQAQFVKEYLVDLNATKAAIRAGYSEESARSIGSENLTKPDIQEAIAEAMAKRSQRVQITADYVLGTIRDTVERCRQAEPVLDREGERTGEYRFDATAVLKGAELLGKHLKMFTDKFESVQEMRFRDLSDEELDQRLRDAMVDSGYEVTRK